MYQHRAGYCRCAAATTTTIFGFWTRSWSHRLLILMLLLLLFCCCWGDPLQKSWRLLHFKSDRDDEILFCTFLSLMTFRDMWMNSGCLWCSGSQSERRRRSSAAARSRSDASDTARHHLDAPRRSSDCTDDLDSMSGGHVPLRDNIYDRRTDDLDLYNYKVCHPESWCHVYVLLNQGWLAKVVLRNQLSKMYFGMSFKH